SDYVNNLFHKSAYVHVPPPNQFKPQKWLGVPNAAPVWHRHRASNQAPAAGAAADPAAAPPEGEDPSMDPSAQGDAGSAAAAAAGPSPDAAMISQQDPSAAGPVADPSAGGAGAGAAPSAGAAGATGGAAGAPGTSGTPGGAAGASAAGGAAGAPGMSGPPVAGATGATASTGAPGGAAGAPGGAAGAPAGAAIAGAPGAPGGAAGAPGASGAAGAAGASAAAGAPGSHAAPSVLAPPAAAAGGSGSGAASEDACATLFGPTARKVFKVTDAFSCYNSFGVTPRLKREHIAALKTYLQFYPFLDQAKKSTKPFFKGHTDLIRRLDQIAADPGVFTEYQLHTGIKSLFIESRDGHLTYKSPCFESALNFLQPFVISARYGDVAGNSTKPTLYVKDVNPLVKNPTAGIASDILHYWQGNSGLSITKFIGYTVSSINGMDSLMFFQQHADQYIGGSRVKDTRFNRMFPMKAYMGGQWIEGDSEFYSKSWVLPDLSPVYDYTLLSPQGKKVVLQVPWAVIQSPQVPPGTFSNRETFYQTLCKAGSSKTTPDLPEDVEDSGRIHSGLRGLERVKRIQKLTSKHFELDDEIDPPVDWQYAKLKADEVKRNIQKTFSSWRKKSKKFNQAPAAGASAGAGAGAGAAAAPGGAPTPGLPVPPLALDKPMASDANTALYMVDSQTVLWVLPSFKPMGPKETALASWFGTVSAGLTQAEAAGATRLIIDVSNNPGGVVCAGHAFLEFLFADMKYVNYDIRRSKLLDTIVKTMFKYGDIKGSFSLSKIRIKGMDGKPKPATSPSEFFPNDPAYIYERGGEPATYSAKFDLDCSSYLEKNRQYLPRLKKGFEPHNIAVISNGLCGSTCSNFVR
ncbi:hypothetical protein HDU67_001559, partial [Dinochytrium kinnereticum]